MKKKNLCTRFFSIILTLCMVLGFIAVPDIKSQAAESSTSITNRDMEAFAYNLSMLRKNLEYDYPENTEDVWESMYYEQGKQAPDILVDYFLRSTCYTDELWAEHRDLIGYPEYKVHTVYEYFVPYDNYIEIADRYFENHSDMKSYLGNKYYEEYGRVSARSLDGILSTEFYYDYLGTEVSADGTYSAKFVYMEKNGTSFDYVNKENVVIEFSVSDDGTALKISGFYKTEDISISNPLIDGISDFEDVPAEAWYYDYVSDVYYDGLMTGIKATYFGANEPLARAQFALILHRLLGQPEMTNENKFPDVPVDSWFAPAVLWAAQDNVKIITGYSNGYFGPADNINREQLAVMMFRTGKYLGIDMNSSADLDSYLDVDSVHDFAKEAMEWAVGAGIITGKYDQKYLDPLGNATRAECAAIIQRFEAYMGLSPIKHDFDDGYVWFPDPIATNEGPTKGIGIYDNYFNYMGILQARIEGCGKEYYEQYGIEPPKDLWDFSTDDMIQYRLPEGCSFSENEYGDIVANWRELDKNGREREIYYVLKQGDGSFGTMMFSWYTDTMTIDGIGGASIPYMASMSQIK